MTNPISKRKLINMTGGPQPVEPQVRRERAAQIAQSFRIYYRDQVLAIGYYGSIARGTDGPYSDIEMHCVVAGTGLEKTFEWNAGPWKAEVNVQSRDVLLEDAAIIEGNWSITHGAYSHVLPVYDLDGFFEQLRAVVYSQQESKYQEAIKELIVGDILEQIGKVRNAWALGNPGYLPTLACELARSGACLIGLANRTLFSSASRMYLEALALPDQPAGYQAVCQLVTSGALSEPERIVEAANIFWGGVEDWAKAKGIRIVEQLDELIEEE
jgi:kanamycin nucleotidyltransferase